MISYDDLGLLRGITIDGELNITQINTLFNHIPFLEGSIQSLADSLGGTVIVVEQDLSFDVFWDRYDYKVGNKARARKLWDQLSNSDRMLAIRKIPVYDSFLIAKRNQDKVYPETFLSQRRFENNFKL